jgi:hypothetical protein
MTHPSFLRMALPCLVLVAATACTQPVVRSNHEGYAVRTYHGADGSIDAIVAKDGDTTIVAVPRMATPRGVGLGGDELSCLKKCRDIEDLEKRLNCILACPVSARFEVVMF